MKNKILLNMGSLAIAFGCIFTCSNFTFNAKAYTNLLGVPEQNITFNTNLINQSNDGIIYNKRSEYVSAIINEVDNTFYIVINNSDGPNGLDDPASGNSYFVVFKDSVTKKILDMKPLNISVHNDEVYDVEYTVNNNIDVVDVEIYSQSTSADKYYPSSATFIGKMRLFTASNSIYLRQGNTQVPITLYLEDGSELTDASLFYNRLTPNLYSIYVPYGNLPLLQSESCCQILTDSTNMSAEDKIANGMLFDAYKPEDATVATGSQVIPNDSGAVLYNFYIPDGVNSFKFKISDRGLVAQGNINLTRD